MCRFKSAIILKDRVFIPDYDSHADMLEELGIEDNRQNAEKLFIRAELSPRNGYVFSNIDNWEFTVDQDITPDWFVKDYDKQRMVEAVKDWAKSHIHIGVDNLIINSGSNHYIKDCTNVQIYGNATVKNIFGNATVENVYGNATVENIFGSATVKNIFGNATVENVYGNATVKNIFGNATVKSIYGNATVENICGSATVKNIFGSATVKKAKGRATIITSPYDKFKNKDKLILLENSTLKDCYNKVIYQSGDYKFVAVSNEVSNDD